MCRIDGSGTSEGVRVPGGPRIFHPPVERGLVFYKEMRLALGSREWGDDTSKSWTGPREK